MTDDERPPSGPWLPEHLRGLTQETATDEQRAEIRAAFHRRMEELDAYWTPERKAALRPDVAKTLAGKQALVDARNAAEAADPSLFWRRAGAEAARSAVLAERMVPAEGVAAFRAAFDEALPRVRAENPLGRTER
ncbi:hypothetical protein GCM10009827_084200 [Dactylosporangium maewongense]|uniref:Uncharacterized protein n=1 Tax=Dactylosporangium maewongense TaxID=634393 RepID=A0ABP4MV05_9ACTN